MILATFRSIFAPKNLPFTLSAAASVAAAVVGLLAGQFATAALAFAVGAVAAGLLGERCGYLERILETISRCPAARVAGISSFSPSRKALPAFEDEIAVAKEDLMIVGNVMGHLVAGALRPLEDRLRAGCRVRLLMMNPVDEKGNISPLLAYFSRITCNPALPSLATINIETLRSWHARLAQTEPEAAGRFDLRLYQTLVTLVIMCIDAHSQAGTIRVELLPHEVEGMQRPSLALSPHQGGTLYGLLRKQYETLWKQSASVVGPHSATRAQPAEAGDPEP